MTPHPRVLRRRDRPRARTRPAEPGRPRCWSGRRTGSIRLRRHRDRRARPRDQPPPAAPSRRPAFSADGAPSATAGADNRILVWDVRRGTVRDLDRAHEVITGLAARAVRSHALQRRLRRQGPDLGPRRRSAPGRPVALRPFLQPMDRERVPFPARGTSAISLDGATRRRQRRRPRSRWSTSRTLRRTTARTGDRGGAERRLSPGRAAAGHRRAATGGSSTHARAAPPAGSLRRRVHSSFSADGRLMVTSGRE